MDDAERPSFQQSGSFYQYLFDAAPDVMVMIDRKGEIQVANSRCQDVLGYAYADMPGRQVKEMLARSNRSGFEVMLTGIRDGTSMPEVEVEVRTRSGKFIPMMLDVREIELAGTGYYLIRFRDLREIKALEQEYRDLFDSIGDAVFTGDAESGQIYQANRRAYELTGYTLGELVGSEYGRVHSEPWEVVLRETRQADGCELQGREMALRTADGGAVAVESHLRLVYRGEEEIYIETVIDISARKALEARMQELRAEWDAFIRHELRNPLTPIMAFSQILIEDYAALQGSPKAKQYLKAIWQSGQRLERLLDLTREVQAYEQGEVPLRRSSTDLYGTVRAAVNDAVLGRADSEEAAAGRVRLAPHSGAGDPPELVLGHDPQKLQRALANLVKNALEHDPGEVTVRVADGADAVSVSVHNRGEPIPPERLRTIFEKFNTTKRAQKGTGLGTTIAKLFVEAHGGRLEVASSAAEGTTFTVTLPK